jgi:predicted nuclease with TOPRIM domain
MPEILKFNGTAKNESPNVMTGSEIIQPAANNTGKTKTLKGWGFAQAGKMGATLAGLRTAMQNVYNNYVVSIMDKESRQKEELKKEMEATREEVIKVTNRIEEIKTHEIPMVQKEMEDLKGEIEDTRIQSKTEFINSNYNSVKHILYTVLSITLGLGLIFFYTSLIYNAVFKDFNDTLLSADGADSTNLFNTLIDVKALFTPNKGVILSYLFSTLFITLGLLVHSDMILKGKLKWVKFASVLLIAIGAELIFAYKIESNIEYIKSLVLMEYQPSEHWWQVLLSVNVLIVITLGFLAYIVWSAIFEQGIKEKAKRDPRKIAEVKIRETEKKIGRRKYKVGELNGEIAKLNGQKKLLEEKLANLGKKLDMIFFNPVELEERLDQFFSGWLTYLNNITEYNKLIPDHQQEYQAVKQQMLTNNNTTN